MKTTSPPSRPSSRPTSNARPATSKAASPALSANERGIARRAQKKKQTRRKNWLVWLGFAAATAIIAGTAFGVSSPYLHIKGITREYKAVKARVVTKQVTLKALQAQLAAGTKRLSAFNGGSGRERALAENGFVRPGERILLFPPDAKTSNGR